MRRPPCNSRHIFIKNKISFPICRPLCDAVCAKGEMADLDELDASLLAGIKDQADLEKEVFHEVNGSCLSHSTLFAYTETFCTQAEAKLRSAETEQDERLLSESEATLRPLREKLDQCRSKARMATTATEKGLLNRQITSLVRPSYLL